MKLVKTSKSPLPSGVTKQGNVQSRTSTIIGHIRRGEMQKEAAERTRLEKLTESPAVLAPQSGVIAEKDRVLISIASGVHRRNRRRPLELGSSKDTWIYFGTALMTLFLGLMLSLSFHGKNPARKTGTTSTTKED